MITAALFLGDIPRPVGIPGAPRARHGDPRDPVPHLSCFVLRYALRNFHFVALFSGMKIRTVKHKGLRRLIEVDDASGLPAPFVDKIRKILSFLQDMEGEDELRSVPSWKAHQLPGDRKGTWSLFVTKNWRITFLIDQAEIEIVELDYEDYH
jgi:proteic killer suppression protein